MSPNLASPPASPVRYDVSLLTADDLYLFNEGSHYRLHDKMGAHLTESSGTPGTAFSVWAPNARNVYVIGSFNGWDHTSHPLRPRGSSGIWEDSFRSQQRRGVQVPHRVEPSWTPR